MFVNNLSQSDSHRLGVYFDKVKVSKYSRSYPCISNSKWVDTLTKQEINIVSVLAIPM